ncbi:MAG: hypothetical protein HRU30_12380 [Rhodobacteraceae bacterium]|nr:hypothetical protein [Paracoccaceae bacterium]
MVKLFGRACLSLLGATVLLGLGSPVVAKTGYLCEFDNLRARGFILSPFVFVLAEDGASATVMDPLILGEKEKPIAAKVRKKSNGALQISWSVNGIGTMSRGADISVSYTSTFDAGKNTIRTRGKLAGLPQIENAKGACRVLDEKWIAGNKWLKKS